MRIVMGVDGGGSKTYSVIVDETGKRLGTGVSGCGNHQVPGIDIASANIRDSLEQAMSKANVTPEQIDYCVYGLAGADREKDFSILRPALAALPVRNWDVVCDTMEGLRIGSPNNIGVVLVCGSGTNAAGRNPEGRTVQTGGFGYLYGDTAGGGHLAAEAFRAAVRSWELRDIPSSLTEKIPRFLGKNSMEQLWNDYLDQDIYRVPNRLAEVAHEAADEGDELAIRLLRDMGKELGIAAASVIRRLGGFDGLTIPIVLTGSIVQKGRNPHLLKALSETVEETYPSVELVIPEMAPVYGSVMLAMDQLGIRVTDQMERHFISYGGYDDEKA